MPFLLWVEESDATSNIYCMIVRENWRFIPPRKILFPEGIARRKFWFSVGNESLYPRTFMKWNFYYAKQHIFLQNTSNYNSFPTFRKQWHRECLILYFTFFLFLLELELWIDKLFFYLYIKRIKMTNIKCNHICLHCNLMSAFSYH